MTTTLRNMITGGTMGLAALAFGLSDAQAGESRAGINIRIGDHDLRVGSHGNHVHVDVASRRFIPGHYEERQVQVLVHKGHFEERHTQVLVEAGHWHEVKTRVLVQAGYWTTRTIPAVYNHVTDRYGRCYDVLVKPACTERVWVPERYEDRCEKVWHPAKYETRCERVWIPDRYETRCERVWVPGCYETVSTPVIGHDHGRLARGR